jgi:hypothetical protein
MTVQSARRDAETFRIDLNSVRDDNRVVTLVGFFRHQVVPDLGALVVAVDEDGAFYDAIVDAVLPDHRIYLRLKWESKRVGMDIPSLSYGSTPQAPVVTGSKIASH